MRVAANNKMKIRSMWKWNYLTLSSPLAIKISKKKWMRRRRVSRRLKEARKVTKQIRCTIKWNKDQSPIRRNRILGYRRGTITCKELQDREGNEARKMILGMIDSRSLLALSITWCTRAIASTLTRNPSKTTQVSASNIPTHRRSSQGPMVTPPHVSTPARKTSAPSQKSPTKTE